MRNRSVKQNPKEDMNKLCRHTIIILLYFSSAQNSYIQAVGPPRYAPPRPAMEVHSGSLEQGWPSQARSANTHHPVAGRPHMLATDRMYATDVRQVWYSRV